jgi:hypothetical protein
VLACEQHALGQLQIWDRDCLVNDPSGPSQGEASLQQMVKGRLAGSRLSVHATFASLIIKDIWILLSMYLLVCDQCFITFISSISLSPVHQATHASCT